MGSCQPTSRLRITYSRCTGVSACHKVIWHEGLLLHEGMLQNSSYCAIMHHTCRDGPTCIVGVERPLVRFDDCWLGLRSYGSTPESPSTVALGIVEPVKGSVCVHFCQLICSSYRCERTVDSRVKEKGSEMQ